MNKMVFLQDEDGYLHWTDDPDYASWLCEECGMKEADSDSDSFLDPSVDEDYQEFLKGGAEESDDIDDE